MSDDNDLSGTPRVGQLNTARGVRTELGKLYKAARRAAGPEPAPSDASKLANILSIIGRSLATEDLEQRIEALERAAGGRP